MASQQHNDAETNNALLELYGGHLPPSNVSDADAIIQIVFKDIQDYQRVRQDPHFISVVNPDHVNFADPKKTRLSMGWFEVHVRDGKVVS